MGANFKFTTIRTQSGKWVKTAKRLRSSVIFETSLFPHNLFPYYHPSISQGALCQASEDVGEPCEWVEVETHIVRTINGVFEHNATVQCIYEAGWRDGESICDPSAEIGGSSLQMQADYERYVGKRSAED